MKIKLDILVIGAHPDDAEIGCGGTIARHKQLGHKIGILDCSNGEPTPHGSPEIRLEEAGHAAKILDIDTRETLDMKNRYIENTIENRIKVADIIRKYQPKIIITHPPRDWHADHVAVNKIVSAAKFQAKLTKTDSPYEEFYPPRIVYFDHAHARIQRKIDFLVNISDTIDVKIRALKAYKSQFIDNRDNRAIFDFIKNKASFLGQQAGIQFAEGFSMPEYFLVQDITTII